MGTDEGYGTPVSSRSSVAVGVSYDSSLTPKGKTFRARKLDILKPLTIYKETELDPEEHATIMMRSVPLLATGVDKEEEDEVHLKVILESGATTSSTNVHIPIPEAAEMTVPYYDSLYPSGTFKLPKQYCKPPAPPRPFSNLLASSSINISTLLTGNTLIGYGFGAKAPLSVPVVTPLTVSSTKQADYHPSASMYNMSEEDGFWLEQVNVSNQNLVSSKKQLSPDLFEKTMFILETLANIHGWETVASSFMTMSEAIPMIDKLFIESQYKIVAMVQSELFTYWKSKRAKSGGIPLSPILKVEDNPKSSVLDPYVCFRRRELRTLRKTRRSDALSIEKLRQLRNHFSEVYEMLCMIVDRDNLKRELLILENTIFRHTIQLEDWKQTFGIVVRSGLIPSTMMLSSTSKFPLEITESIITGKKRIRAIVSDPYEGQLSDNRVQRPSYPALLFGLRKTYAELRTVYYRSGVDQQDVPPSTPFTSLANWSSSASQTPTFSTSNPWLYFFHPIEAARLVESDLDIKVNADQKKPIPMFDFVQTSLTCKDDRPIVDGNEEILEPFITKSRCAYRIGRGGRVIIDRLDPSKTLERSRASGTVTLASNILEINNATCDIDTVRILNVQDLSELNNIRISKYHEHSQGVDRSLGDPSDMLGDWNNVLQVLSTPIAKVSANAAYGSTGTTVMMQGTSASHRTTTNRIGAAGESSIGHSSSSSTQRRKKKKVESVESDQSRSLDPSREAQRKRKDSNGANDQSGHGGDLAEPEKKRKRPQKRPNTTSDDVNNSQTDHNRNVLSNSSSSSNPGTKAFTTTMMSGSSGVVRSRPVNIPGGSQFGSVNGSNSVNFQPLTGISNAPPRPGTMPVTFSKVGGVTITGLPSQLLGGAVGTISSNTTSQSTLLPTQITHGANMTASATHLHTMQNNSLDAGSSQITVRVRSRSNDHTNGAGPSSSGENSDGPISSGSNVQ